MTKKAAKKFSIELYEVAIKICDFLYSFQTINCGVDESYWRHFKKLVFFVLLIRSNASIEELHNVTKIIYLSRNSLKYMSTLSMVFLKQCLSELASTF